VEIKQKAATNSGYQSGQSYLRGSGLQPIDWPGHHIHKAKKKDLKKWRLLKLLQLNLHKLWPESSSFWFTGLLCGYANGEPPPPRHTHIHPLCAFENA